MVWSVIGAVDRNNPPPAWAVLKVNDERHRCKVALIRASPPPVPAVLPLKLDSVTYTLTPVLAYRPPPKLPATFCWNVVFPMSASELGFAPQAHTPPPKRPSLCAR